MVSWWRQSESPPLASYNCTGTSLHLLAARSLLRSLFKLPTGCTSSTDIIFWWSLDSLDPRPNLRGRIWGKTLPGSVLSAGMLLSVLMREQASLQPTSVRVKLMTGSEYTVEHRKFENWNSTWPIALKIWKRKFAEFRDRGIPARHFRARLFPRPFLAGWVWGPD